MELEVRHLRVLVAVADEGSITKAAAALGLPQPALSAQVRRIERAVGDEVFARGRTGVEVTPFGRGLLARARGVLRELDGIVVHAHQRTRAEITLGDAGMVLSEVVPRLEAEIGAEYAVRVHIDIAAGALVSMLRAGSLDAALISEPVGFETTDARGLRRETVVPVEPVFVGLWEHHPLAAHPEIDLADLADEAWIVNPQDNPGWLAALRTACADRGFTPRVAYEAVHQTGARSFVGSGRCVAIADALSLDGGGVVFRPLTGTPLRGRIDLAWTDRYPLPTPQLARLVRESYRSLVDLSPTYRDWWLSHVG
jgi:DNA-binding transcriptional LysR family regulator